MKKVLLSMLLLFSAITVGAQFKADFDGVKTLDGKNFYVVEIPGKSASDLYKSANAFIISNFKNPNVVSNKMENEMINLHGTYPDAFVCKKVMGMKVYAKVDMNLVMYFKEGRVRFDIPTINSMYFNDKDQVMFSGGINIMGDGDINMFKKNGKVNKEECVENFNSFINGVVNIICDYLKGNNKTDDNW